MAFSYCDGCRRYHNTAKRHDCPAPRVVKAIKKLSWWRPWMVETAADRTIARKFAKCKSMAMSFAKAA